MEEKIKILRRLVKYYEVDMIFLQREIIEKSGVSELEFNLIQKQLIRDGLVELSTVDNRIIITKSGRELINKGKGSKQVMHYTVAGILISFVGLLISIADLPLWFSNNNSEIGKQKEIIVDSTSIDESKTVENNGRQTPVEPNSKSSSLDEQQAKQEVPV